MKLLSTILGVVIMAQVSVFPVAAAAADNTMAPDGSMQIADMSLSNGGSCPKKTHRFRRTSTTTTTTTVPVTKTYTSESTSTSTQTIPAPVQQQVVTQPACAEPCPVQMIQQPAVVERPVAVCPPRRNLAWLAAPLVLGGIATAIAVPIAVHHHHHHRVVAAEPIFFDGFAFH
jgi:hypothetical protein